MLIIAEINNLLIEIMRYVYTIFWVYLDQFGKS